jgi:YHS domain-containing protein
MVRFVLFTILLILVVRAASRLWRGMAAGIAGSAYRSTTGSTAAKPAVQMVRDPVCGTFVVPERAVTLSTGQQQLHFCSTTCRDTYRAARPS